MSIRKRAEREYSAHLQGTLDLLILRSLILGPQHGQGLARLIQRESDNVLVVDHGSLYPALQRMRQKGWIRAEWRQTPNNQRARYYTITAAGRKQLGVEEAGFEAMLAAIGRVMSTK